MDEIEVGTAFYRPMPQEDIAVGDLCLHQHDLHPRPGLHPVRSLRILQLTDPAGYPVAAAAAPQLPSLSAEVIWNDDTRSTIPAGQLVKAVRSHLDSPDVVCAHITLEI